MVLYVCCLLSGPFNCYLSLFKRVFGLRQGVALVGPSAHLALLQCQSVSCGGRVGEPEAALSLVSHIVAPW